MLPHKRVYVYKKCLDIKNDIFDLWLIKACYTQPDCSERKRVGESW